MCPKKKPVELRWRVPVEPAEGRNPACFSIPLLSIDESLVDFYAALARLRCRAKVKTGIPVPSLAAPFFLDFDSTFLAVPRIVASRRTARYMSSEKAGSSRENVPFRLVFFFSKRPCSQLCV